MGAEQHGPTGLWFRGIWQMPAGRCALGASWYTWRVWKCDRGRLWMAHMHMPVF